uniref:Uncharacterized protein n=1 Tax=Lutzomyia longipalpis TaxID=7200 RepID=A0A1B0CFF5_LUTLO
MVSPQDIVAQVRTEVPNTPSYLLKPLYFVDFSTKKGKCLCLQYIRFRLKRAGALNRKVIQRLRTITIESPATNTIIRDVFPILNGDIVAQVRTEVPNTPSYLLKPLYFVDFSTKKGKCLCLQYIRFRLKRAGALNRKVIQRLRTITIESPATNTIIRDVFPILNGLGEELERMHPRVYSNVGRQLSRAWSDLPDAETLSLLLAEVAKELFRGGTSWARALPRLVEVFGHVVEEDLMGWLEARGGWKGLLAIRAAGADYTVMGWLSIGVAVVSSVYLATCILDSLRRLIL